MIGNSPDLADFDSLRPELLALLELHRAAQTDEARAELVKMFERAFLAAAWHIAQDLLEHGWRPGFAPEPKPAARLTVVGGTDAA